MSESVRPRIALLLGDPAGIGPEVMVKLLSDSENRKLADVVVVGDSALWQQGMVDAKREVAYRVVTELGDDGAQGSHDPEVEPVTIFQPPSVTTQNGGESVTRAVASALAGQYVLESSRVALDLAQRGMVDGVCFAPFNKQAMHLAGSPFEDDLRYFAHLLECDAYVGELNVLNGLWSARVTSHVPLCEVAQYITFENIESAVLLVVRSLRKAGISNPRIAVAALNPHAGEGGLFGREEIDVIEPAVAHLAASVADATISGPYPSDTVFIKARDGEFDAVVTMYHDQGQVAMKLMGFSEGVTVHGGLPVVVTTPAHGTAYDIVGQGTADSGAMTTAFRLACQMTSLQK